MNPLSVPSGEQTERGLDGLPCAPAGVVETDTSVLFFLADRVYKVKKPVHLATVDLRDRLARLAACRAEVALNRRLAPDIYLGVSDVLGPDGQASEHMVVMRRLPESRRLSVMLERRADVTADIREVAAMLAEFHAHCDTSPEIAAAGNPDRLRGQWESLLADVERWGGTTLAAGVLADVRQLGTRYLGGRETLLWRRYETGRIRDGHGDLLSSDIFCLGDGPRVLDCQEGDSMSRAGDVLSDSCALATDFERLGRRDLARLFLDQYRELAGQRHPRSLEDYYLAYRALTRCRAACDRHLRSVPGAAAEARTYAELALAALRRGRVRLVLVGGVLPAARQTSLARSLAEAEGWVLLTFAAVRAELTGTAEADLAGPGSPISPAESRAVHHELLRQAETALRQGESVVLDAPWTRHSHRCQASDLARRTMTDLVQLRYADLGTGVPARPAACAGTGEGVAAEGSRDPAATDAYVEPWPEAKTLDSSLSSADVVRRARRSVA